MFRLRKTCWGEALIMPKNLKQVNQYYLGKNQGVAVIENQESACPLLNNSDIVILFNQTIIDFEDEQNDLVAKIKKDGYMLFMTEKPNTNYT